MVQRRGTLAFTFISTVTQVISAGFALRPDVEIPHAAGGGADQERGAEAQVLRSHARRVSPASEAALQWAVKGSYIPNLRGLSVAEGTRRARRDMISFKACDSEVFTVQHNSGRRRTAKTAALSLAARAAECNVFPVQQGGARTQS